VRAGVVKRVGAAVFSVALYLGGKRVAERLLVGVSAGTVKASRWEVRAGAAKRVGATDVSVVF